ncbi:cytochrome P450 [Geopyxis carbonaria]|nr:cytochrome P450 [Geopyxis carbonaria]
MLSDTVLDLHHAGFLRLAVILSVPAIAFSIILRLFSPRKKVALQDSSSNEPPMLPYIIPGLAHAIYVAIDIEAVFRQAVRLFGFGRPFTLLVGGKKLYIFTEPKDVAEIFRRAKTLTFAKFLPFTLSRVCDTSPDGIQKMQGAGGNSLEMVHHFFSSRLAHGPGLDGIAEVFQRDLRAALTASGITGTMGKRDMALGGGTYEVSCYSWVRSLMVRVSTPIMFGPELLQINPNIPELIFAFEDGLYKVASGLPRFMAATPYDAREQLRSALDIWIQRKAYLQAASFVRESVEHCLEKGLNSRDAASVMLGILLATQANAATASFWSLLHIATNPLIVPAVKREVALAPDAHNMDAFFDASPALNAVYNEVLRFYASSPSHRMAEEPTTLAGYTMPKDAVIIVPIRQSHLNPETWGANANEFDPQRFMWQPELAKSQMFRPYGGGNSLCSGRLLSKREIFIFLSEVLREFDVEIVGGQKVVPAGYDKRSGAGLLCPKDRNVDIRMVLRRIK